VYTREQVLDPLYQLSEYYSPEENHARQTYIYREIKRVWYESESMLTKYADKLGSISAAMKYIRIKERNADEQKLMDDIEYIQRLTEEQAYYEKAIIAHFACNAF
jgi:hypothetical protein